MRIYIQVLLIVGWSLLRGGPTLVSQKKHKQQPLFLLTGSRSRTMRDLSKGKEKKN
jgi:hypothetical protein